MKPIEYFKQVQGWGTWRIDYDTAAKKWRLCYNLRVKGERWEPAGRFIAPESAAAVIGERKTGFAGWDMLRFARGVSFDLASWKREASDGVQSDASDGVSG